MADSEDYKRLFDAETGLPSLTDEEQRKSSVGLVVAVFFVWRVLGGAIAVPIYLFSGKELYNKRISNLLAFKDADGESVPTDFAYVLWFMVIFSWLSFFLNLYPVLFKDRVLPLNAEKVRANMYIYKVNSQDGKRYPAVVMEDDGVVGQYNRANRGLTHFNEWSVFVGVQFYVASLIFAIPVFVLAIVFALGRISYQTGSASKGWPSGTFFPGFTFTMISMHAVELLLLISAVVASMRTWALAGLYGMVCEMIARPMIARRGSASSSAPDPTLSRL